MLREALRAAPDLSRALARLVGGSAAARAIWAISATRSRRRARCATVWRKSRWRAKRLGAADAITQGMAAVSRLADRLELLLVDEPPYLARDGGFIRAGVHAPLDEVRALRDESRRVIAGAGKPIPPEPAASPQLKIKHNGVLGYFIEVTQQHADKLMAMNAICSAIARPWRARCAFPPTNWPILPAASPKPANRRWRWNARCSTR